MQFALSDLINIALQRGEPQVKIMENHLNGFHVSISATPG
jgi:hypothetical protein